MIDKFIYNERWMNETEQRLKIQRRKLAELRDKLRKAQNASGSDWAAEISYTLSRVERLEHSLKRTGDILARFRDQVEAQNRRTVADYEEALIQARRVFF